MTPPLKIMRRTLLKGAACSLLSRPALAYLHPGAISVASGLKINYTNDSSNSWNSAPAAYTTILNKAIADLCSWIANPVTLNIQVGYGTSAGSSMTGLGETFVSYAGTGTYAALISALNAQPTDAVKTSAYPTLPGSAPGGSIVVITSAQAAALGFSQSNPDFQSGWKTSGFDTTHTDGSFCTSGLYSLYGAIQHELTEGMGRQSLVSLYPTEIMMTDLLSFSGSGAHSYTTSGLRYFSSNNGVTNSGTYNQSAGTGDLGDWTNATASPFDVDGTTGLAGTPRQQDLQIMAAIGWTLTAAGRTMAGI